MYDKDLYQVLGVSHSATEAELKKAYHSLAKKHHPDRNPGDKAAEQKFKEANLAYEVLKDPKKRAQYDQMRSMGQNPFARGGGGQWQSTGPFQSTSFGDAGLADLFEQIFGGGGFGGFGPMEDAFRAGRTRTTGGTRTRGFSQRGADREASLIISFLEAARGGERTLELPGGKRITVKIPEGVETGSRIKLGGQGEAGVGGGPAGDLIITLQVLHHETFTREGNDVVLELPISFSEAVLGAEVPIPTLDGSVRLTLPKGISSGQRLKLSHKGIRSSAQSERGHQFVQVMIRVPKEPDKQYLEAAKLLGQSSFNPRA